MALHVRPLSEGFALAYAYDPAFDIDRPDHIEGYKRALDTLDFSPLVKNGQPASMFHFRALALSELRALHALGRDVLMPWLAFRLCLQRVDNCTGLEQLQRAPDPEYPSLGSMVSLRQTNLIDAVPLALGRVAGELITDLGHAVIARSATPSPL